MRVLGRRGFTLVELMIAIVLLAIFSGGLYQVLLNNQRAFTAQTQRIDLQQNIRAAATILPGEFRELDTPDSDISYMDSVTITIRAMRQLAFMCQAPVLGGGLGNISFTVRAAPFFGDRQYFQVNDSLLIFYEGNPQTRSDDQWVRGQVKGVANLACPDGKAGNSITMAPQWVSGGLNVAGAITNGSPVRGFTTLTYKLWQSGTDNQYYLAQQVGGGTPQPLVGPLSGANGLTFSYYDSTGTTLTTSPEHVALIGVKLRARTSQVVRQANDAALAYKYDSVTIQVAVRNNPRCGTGSMPFVAC
jgi:prepilin-type N-terminal cleavage/methylation domain-containing protein